ncbi:MAG: cyclic nucleotide-binding domain-containing protein [Armatimonadota bacterium]|nr:cyclic nucleotide-binding domain-containing protein [Armatimonadota bacterium]MDW8155561.1 cyclic nucleotide-binding domain-containing protein [Armatimonadota bacterium]
MKTLEELLAEHPFFRGMRTDYIRLFAGCASNVRFEEGAYLFREGEAADRLFLIRQGRVALELHTPQGVAVIQTLSDGDVVGWSWMVPPYRWAFDARALGLVRAVSFDAACLRRKAEEDPALGYELLKRLVPVIVERLQATRLQLLDLYGEPKGRVLPSA